MSHGATMRAAGLALLAGLALAGAAEARTLVFGSDFDGGLDARWSGARIETAPRTRSGVLGRLGCERAMLKLAGLPAHTMIRLRVTVLIIGAWQGDRLADGRNQIIGPDQWGVALDERPLLHTTFSNATGVPAGGTQAFPGWAGEHRFAPRTGSVGRDQLGFTWGEDGGRSTQVDTRYRLDLWVPHRGATLALAFYGINLPTDKAASWALDDLIVEAHASDPGRPDDEALAAAWAALDGQQRDATQALWTLGRGGARSVARIRSAFRGGADLRIVRRVKALIARLDDPAFAARQAATAALRQLGEPALPLIERALSRQPRLEVRWRLEVVRDGVRRRRARADAPGARRRRAALRVLALLGTPEARALYATLAGAPPGAAAFVPGSRWYGWCSQDGYPTYPIRINVLRRTGEKISGEIHWPDTNDSLTRWRGTLRHGELEFVEYELVRGSGVVIPVNYQLRIVGHRLTGVWFEDDARAGLQVELVSHGGAAAVRPGQPRR